MNEEDLIPLSALQHYLYCPRQCALIHIEQAWDENLCTAEGRLLHEKTHGEGTESRGDIRTAFGVRLVSIRLGLSGQADAVEFHRANAAVDESGRNVAVRLPGVRGLWIPYPVEYKRGRPKTHQADEVQLCAQALCLEEMLQVRIPAGSLYYGKTRRRKEVLFTDQLRGLTEETAGKLHRLFESGATPTARYEKSKCDWCSLMEYCQPLLGGRQSVSRYIQNMLTVSYEKTT